MKTQLLISILILNFIACSETKEIPQGKSMSLTSSKTTTCQLIEKKFTNKGGKVAAYQELYLRCSIQDYFIKFCEGKVTAKELRPYINSGIEVEMEIKQGMWDHCSDNPAYAQSRTGTYVVINKIIK